jgi:hypothetical protein
MTKRQQTSRLKRILVSEKIAAQRKLVASFGIDEATWSKLTQKQLDYFWQEHCSEYVLVHIKGELKYVPFDSIEAKGATQ